MTITLTAEQERIVQAQLAIGQFCSVEEVLDKALAPLNPHLPNQNCITKARALVRRGSFLGAATDDQLIRELTAIPADAAPESNVNWLSARALLAEIYDQTGQYEKIAPILQLKKNLSKVQKSLREQAELAEIAKVDLENEKNNWRRLLRAKALYTIQAAIYHMRRFEPDKSLLIMVECEKSVRTACNSTFSFHGVLRMLHYWQGRVQMSRNALVNALSHFKEAMRESERNLQFHYLEDFEQVHEGDERIAHETYSLSSAMAFGIANVNHIRGQLTQALDLLRPASAMLMATGDNFRRGYVLMLIGAAERALAGAEQAKLEKAISTLHSSFKLFTGRGVDDEPPRPARIICEHSLHSARVLHQLALAKVFFSAKCEHDRRKQCLLTAETYLRRAYAEMEHFAGLGFKDYELAYDIWLTRSRVYRAKAQFEQARQAAVNALSQASDYKYAPQSSIAKVHIAIAETYIDEAQKRRGGEKTSLLDYAKRELRQALEYCNNHSTIATIINLYEAKILLTQGHVQPARQKYRDAWHRREVQVQNGWVCQLAADIESEIKPADSEFSLNFEHMRDKLLRKGSNDTLWDSVSNELKRSLIEWAEAKGTPLEAAPKLLGLTASGLDKAKRKLKDIEKAE